MLEKLFKSRTTVRLLKLLIFGKPLHLRGISRRIGITPTYVKKELECLRELGLVSNKRFGNLSIWEANRASPIFEEMKRIFLKTEVLGDEIGRILDARGIELAFIYGSFAKGDESEKSDIDLLIIGKVEERLLIKAVSKAERAVGREINYILWTRKEFEEKALERTSLLRNILANPVIMVRGEESELRKPFGGKKNRGI